MFTKLKALTKRLEENPMAYKNNINNLKLSSFDHRQISYQLTLTLVLMSMVKNLLSKRITVCQTETSSCQACNSLTKRLHLEDRLVYFLNYVK